MGQVLTKNEGFSDFCEGWVPFLLEIKQKAGWLVGMIFPQNSTIICIHIKIILSISYLTYNFVCMGALIL